VKYLSIRFGPSLLRLSGTWHNHNPPLLYFNIGPAGDLHGHAEAVTSRPTPAYHHLNSTHHSCDIWFAAILPSIHCKKAAYALRFSTPVVLYKRLVLGEPQRKLPRPGEPNANQKIIEFGRKEST
jgi:hypothetical protein